MTSLGGEAPERDFAARWLEARAGNEAAREALLLPLRPAVRRFIGSRMGAGVRRWAEPDDVEQATFLDAVRRMSLFPDDLSESELRSFLFVIASRQIAEVRRKARDAGWSEVPGDEVCIEVTDTGLVTRADDERHLAELIGLLPREQAEVVHRRVIDHQSVDAIARELDVSFEAVKKRLFRGRRALARFVNRGPRDGATPEEPGDDAAV